MPAPLSRTDSTLVIGLGRFGSAVAERVRLSAAPFVEGLLGAYGAAGIGKNLAAVAAEADGAAEAKRSQVAAF